MSSNPEHKLYHYKADPPPTAWDAIAAKLDEQQASYPDKLYNFQQAPPPNAWQKIEEQLPVANSGSQVVAMPVQRKIVRYAAAAVLLLALVGIAYFAQPDNKTETVAGTNQSSLPTENAAPPIKRDLKHFNVPPQKTVENAVAAKETTTPRYAALIPMIKRRVPKKQSKINLPIEPVFASALEVAPIEKNIINTDRTDRYMIATTDDGSPVRLPKKVYSAFACPDEPTHNACELQLTLLQQKMSASFTTDFAHFLDLLKNLQENSR